jgi:hypothetical protein
MAHVDSQKVLFSRKWSGFTCISNKLMILHQFFTLGSTKTAWWPTIFSRSAKSWPYPTTESFQAAKE